MLQNKQAAMLTLALLITLMIVGSGIWWLRINVFLKNPSPNTTLKSSQKIYTSIARLNNDNLYISNNNSGKSGIIFLLSQILHAPELQSSI